MPLDDKPGVVKVGEFMGCPVYVDASLEPDRAVVISRQWDEWAKRMVVKDRVDIINLRLR